MAPLACRWVCQFKIHTHTVVGLLLPATKQIIPCPAVALTRERTVLVISQDLYCLLQGSVLMVSCCLSAAQTVKTTCEAECSAGSSAVGLDRCVQETRVFELMAVPDE